jgi:hypothetical protein
LVFLLRSACSPRCSGAVALPPRPAIKSASSQRSWCADQRVSRLRRPVSYVLVRRPMCRRRAGHAADRGPGRVMILWLLIKALGSRGGHLKVAVDSRSIVRALFHSAATEPWPLGSGHDLTAKGLAA